MANKLVAITLLSSIVLLSCISVSVTISSSSSFYNVVSFGAKPDGRTDSTQPFLLAWMAACSSARPAMVYVPQGTFLIRSVTFNGPCRNRIVFEIDGTLVAPWDYHVIGNTGNWIYFKQVSWVSVHGGTIDARGAGFWACRKTSGPCPAGARSITFNWANNILISGLTSINSQLSHIVINSCNNVMVRKVKIIAPDQSPNTDGIHVQLSTGVTISGSSTRTGDDCISIDPGTRNLWMEDIQCGLSHGIRGFLSRISNWVCSVTEIPEFDLLGFIEMTVDSSVDFSIKPRLMEKLPSFRGGVMEKQKSFRGGVMEKQKSFRGLMEKQKSFLIAMERQLSFGGERKRGKDSPGKRGDSPLHLAARAGNASKVRDIFQRFDANVVKELLSKQNQEGETALYVTAENGHAQVVTEFLKHLDLQTASIAAKNGYDPFHIAAKQGHLEVLKELLHSFPNLVMTTDSSNSTALHTAAAQGHIDIVNLLLEADSNLAKIARNNGKTVLHTAARMGYLEVVKSILSKDSSIGFRTDKKGQIALHMAVKGQSVEIVLELSKSDPSVLNLEDNKGNTALHVAISKGKVEIARCLLSIEGVNIHAINKAGDTPLDIAEKFGTPELVTILRESKATNARDHGKPPNAAKQLKQTVSDIKHDVQSQLQQTRQTGVKVRRIAKKLKKLHISGLNNAINSATVVAVLIATVAFAAIFTVPGQFVEEPTDGSSLGQAHVAEKPAFIIFFVSDSAALFISLAVVLVQTSLVVIEHEAKKQLVFVINKLMWLACLCISIAFVSLSYIVVGSKERWLAVSITLIGSVIMVTTIGSMCFCVVRQRIKESRSRNISRTETLSGSFSVSRAASDTEILNEKYKSLYAV
ncbi:hypothetical protein ACSBR2_030117 [Camellia fascicularis]